MKKMMMAMMVGLLMSGYSVCCAQNIQDWVSLSLEQRKAIIKMYNPNLKIYDDSIYCLNNTHLSYRDSISCLEESHPKETTVDAMAEEWKGLTIDQRREEVKGWDVPLCEECLSIATSYSDYRDMALKKIETERVEQEQKAEQELKEREQNEAQEREKEEQLRNKIEIKIKAMFRKKSDGWIETRYKELNKKKYGGGANNHLSMAEDIEYDLIVDERIIRKRRAEKERRDTRIKTFSPGIQQSIKERKVRIGMTREQVVLSWGRPEQINRTVGKWGVHEQWIYGRTYLYFENDILDGFQDSR